MNELLIIAIALILGLLSTRLMKIIGMPNVTGYLIVGLIIGPYALGQFLPFDITLTPEQTANGLTPAQAAFDNLGIISSVALGFIGFSIGVEFKISHIKEIGKSAVVITFCQALMATLCVDAILIAMSYIPALGMERHEAIILGAIATATAPAATLMVVRQYKAKGVVTGTLLPVVALDDAVGLVVFSISNSIALSMASSADKALEAGTAILDFLVWPLTEIIASLVIGLAIGALLSLIPRFFKSRDNRLIASIVAVFLSLGICELFSWLESKYGCPFKLSDLLVCMMAGATFVNLRKEATLMMEGMDHWTPVVLMLFFILSGAELDLLMFGKGWGLVVCLLLYVVFRCVGKYFGTMLGATIVKSDPNVKKYLGITLFPQAGVAIGMATMCKKEFDAVGLPDVGSKIVTITMCAVLIYELVGPLLTKWALMRAGEIDPANAGGKRRKKVVAEVLGSYIPSAEGAPASPLNEEVTQETQSSVETTVVENDTDSLSGDNKK
ncbi:MAG: cation:proton antiporter [Corallococcus sp.]|nr:cation:proton antiporter [Corallococcus sp.]MCM1359249.1 cation:proton antiporter [Corallococcus sp.]MCM1394640.1 cation:proton antiporter [Corallococcus sp.]